MQQNRKIIISSPSRQYTMFYFNDENFKPSKNIFKYLLENSSYDSTLFLFEYNSAIVKTTKTIVAL